MKVAISSDFFTALSKLTNEVSHKTIKLIEKFRKNPKATGLNYEKLHGTENMHSLRVDRGYRCILMSPKQGDVYILLWVDAHDRAYDWAKRHRCIINPESGNIQVIQTQYETKIVTNQQEEQGFFSQFKDKELMKLGVPETLLLLVKGIENEEQLDEIQEGYLTDEVYEALFYLLAGDSFEDVYRMLYSDTEDQVDTQDFVKALESESAKRNFYVVEEDDTELSNMLNAPLEKWRVFLHPTQQKLVYGHYNGAVRVLGGAGTGKTVVAMHRAKFLAQQLKEGQKLLFTTFTKNLAIDIYENLKKICDREVLERIEVKNFDQWVYEFLSSNGYEDKIIYGNQKERLWDEALSIKPKELDKFEDSFFKEEWTRVIQPQSVNSLNDYIKASRVGRGTRLNRKQRRAIWEVFEEYRRLLSSHNYKEPSDAMRDARLLIEQGKLITTYSSVVVDEAQDFNAQAFMLLRAMVSEGRDDMFIVGDAHQRIYGQKVVLGQCGVKIVGRGKKLKLNYRTTDEIKKWAVAILEGEEIDDLDDGTDSNRDYKSLYHGPKPEVKFFESFEEEIADIEQYINLCKKEDAESRICIVARKQDLVSSYYNHFKQSEIGALKISRDSKDNLAHTGVRVATMHRVKGLDFDHVIIASLNKDISPLKVAIYSNERQIEEELIRKEKALVFVSATRAKKTLLITSYGERSEFLK